MHRCFTLNRNQFFSHPNQVHASHTYIVVSSRRKIHCQQMFGHSTEPNSYWKEIDRTLIGGPHWVGKAPHHACKSQDVQTSGSDSNPFPSLDRLDETVLQKTCKHQGRHSHHPRNTSSQGPQAKEPEVPGFLKTSTVLLSAAIDTLDITHFVPRTFCNEQLVVPGNIQDLLWVLPREKDWRNMKKQETSGWVCNKQRSFSAFRPGRMSTDEITLKCLGPGPFCRKFPKVCSANSEFHRGNIRLNTSDQRVSRGCFWCF